VHRILSIISLGAVMGLAAAGCAPPVLVVRHRLPPDLPLPAEARRVHLGEVTVASGPADGYAKFAADALAERLARAGALEVAAPGADADLVLGATLRIDLGDEAGRRNVQEMESETRRLATVGVPTLVRTAAVHADFVVTRAADGRRLGAVEADEAYRSTADPRVRGPLGLGRPDDPARVPSAETVVRELLGACADTLGRMLESREVVARVPLRPAPGAASREGFAAAGKGDFAAAAGHFRAALDAAPASAAARFNLAAALEAGGDLRAALALYEKVAEESEGRDLEAGEAVLRLTRATATPKL